MKREPLFNVPPVVIAVVAVLVLVRVVQEYVFTPEQNEAFLNLFAFVPARYDATPLPGGVLPGGFGADIWSFFTYALIHADWMHLIVNTVWFLPFGSAVARRFGPLRFLVFFAVAAGAGALAHLFAHGGQFIAVIGASGAISGMMAAAMRFVFQGGGPLGFWRGADDAAYRVPALPLSGLWRDPRVLAFLGVWFGLNALFGLGSIPIAGSEGQVIAWQAHIGGFLAGLFLFSWFDPVPDEPDFADSGPTFH